MNKRFIILLFALCGIVYFIGLQLTLMDIDASQYASMSREMLVSRSFLQVYDLGQDYLDKPPMLFWLSALNMKIFGINHFAYRLPSFIFALLAIFSTYRFTLLFHKKEIAVFAALILASCQGMFLIIHDVRTDTMLMGWVALSIWQVAQWTKNKKIVHLLFGCIAIAGGMMTKGPIALMVPVFAFVPHWLLKRDWKYFFKSEYLVGLLVIVVLLIPMSIGLYQQFDLHPEKVVNGKTGVSGIRFFYWTQSFGRITGESSWKEYGYFFFLLQNMLWSFLPWIFFFLIAICIEIYKLVKQKFKLTDKQEWISTGGFIVTYCMLSRSQAQLPHYIFVAFPFAAIVTAKFLYSLLYEEKYLTLRRLLFWFHAVLFTLLWIALIVLLWWPFPEISKIIPVIAILVFIALIYLLWKDLPLPRIFCMSIFTIAGLNFFVNSSLYPQLLKYQAGSEAGMFISKKNIPKDKVKIYDFQVGRSMHFYGESIFETTDSLHHLEKGDIVLTSLENKIKLDSAGFHTTTLLQGADYHISKLSLRFLNPKTREARIKKYVLAEIN